MRLCAHMVCVHWITCRHLWVFLALLEGWLHMWEWGGVGGCFLQNLQAVKVIRWLVRRVLCFSVLCYDQKKNVGLQSLRLLSFPCRLQLLSQDFLLIPFWGLRLSFCAIWMMSFQSQGFHCPQSFWITPTSSLFLTAIVQGKIFLKPSRKTCFLGICFGNKHSFSVRSLWHDLWPWNILIDLLHTACV